MERQTPAPADPPEGTEPSGDENPDPKPEAKAEARPRRRKKLIAVTLGVPLVILGLLGFAHTSPGRPLLGLLGRLTGSGGGCPAGLARATPAQLEQGRGEAMKPLRGSDKAPSRAALSFTLTETTKAAVKVWASGANVQCVDELK